jgi:hypothetical protein
LSLRSPSIAYAVLEPLVWLGFGKMVWATVINWTVINTYALDQSASEHDGPVLKGENTSIGRASTYLIARKLPAQGRSASVFVWVHKQLFSCVMDKPLTAT